MRSPFTYVVAVGGGWAVVHGDGEAIQFWLTKFTIFFQTSGSNLTFLSVKTLERCWGELSEA